MVFKPTTLLVAIAAICHSGSLCAGGSDITLMPTETLFEKGNYASVSTVNVTPDVTGSNIAPSGSMYGSYRASTFSLKMGLSPKISVAYADYLSAGIYVDYRTAGVATDAYVDLSIRSQMLVAKYQINENLSAFGGFKRSKTKPATANFDNAALKPTGNLSISSASDSTLALGLAYEKPEIGLRVSALFQEKTNFTLPMTRDAGGALIDGKASLPESVTIRFQSGISKNTLVFGSIHKARWGKSHIYFDDGTGSLIKKTDYLNSSSYALGIGRKLSESYAVSATYGYEPGKAATGSSALATTNGKKSISVGGKYTNGKVDISLGYSHINVGNKLIGGAHNFTNNHVNAVAMKLGIHF
ncbi:hypothetical protein N9X05_04910 [Paracoccaceae bacterium]|jgi:long-chain fatty acid transport protein|nr:hypothetical protein [Paracoccaceae bacterium]